MHTCVNIGLTWQILAKALSYADVIEKDILLEMTFKRRILPYTAGDYTHPQSCKQISVSACGLEYPSILGKRSRFAYNHSIMVPYCCNDQLVRLSHSLVKLLLDLLSWKIVPHNFLSCNKQNVYFTLSSLLLLFVCVKRYFRR